MPSLSYKQSPNASIMQDNASFENLTESYTRSRISSEWPPQIFGWPRPAVYERCKRGGTIFHWAFLTNFPPGEYYISAKIISNPDSKLTSSARLISKRTVLILETFGGSVQKGHVRIPRPTDSPIPRTFDCFVRSLHRHASTVYALTILFFRLPAWHTRGLCQNS